MVLIVEDEALLVILAVSVLQAAGYDTVSAGTVAEAVNIIEDPEQKLDLLFTDLGLADQTVGGLAVGQTMAKAPRTFLAACRRSICPTVFGLIYLIGMFEFAADGDGGVRGGGSSGASPENSKPDNRWGRLEGVKLPGGRARTLVGRSIVEKTRQVEIMNYDAEYRREDAAGAIGSHARH
jgi:CheY-like chemotaxis protein